MNLISELEDVLREEQELLLSGNLEDLEGLMARKSALAQKLAENRPNVSEERYRELARKADHNEALLEAARRGLKAAIQQIRQSTDTKEQNTYLKSGARQPLSRMPSTITQKA